MSFCSIVRGTQRTGAGCTSRGTAGIGTGADLFVGWQLSGALDEDFHVLLKTYENDAERQGNMGFQKANKKLRDGGQRTWTVIVGAIV